MAHTPAGRRQNLRRVQPLHRVGSDANIRVHQQDETARRFGDTDVSAGARTVIAIETPDPDMRPVVRQPLGGAISTGDVDNGDAIRRAARIRERGERRG